MAQACTAVVLLALSNLSTASPGQTNLGGEVGQAACATDARFRFAPFDSLPWLRADLTNEKVSDCDDQ